MRVGLVHGRMPPREKEQAMHAVQGREDRLARRDHRHRSRRRRAERDPHGHRERRAHGPRATAPAARPRRTRRAREHCVLLYGGSFPSWRARGSRRSAKPTMASRSPAATWSCAGRANCWAPARPGSPSCAIADLVRDADLLPAVQSAAESLLNQDLVAVSGAREALGGCGRPVRPGGLRGIAHR